MVVHPWVWALFGGLVLAFLALDLFMHRGSEQESRRSAVVWSIIWVAVGLGFGGFIWAYWGGARAQEYIAAYLIEKALSVDNLFVFLVVFASLRIPRELQRVVLSWGIFGALVFRAIFIWLGAEALERWSWVAYIFGAILFYAAWRTLRDDPSDDTENKAVSWLSRHLPVTHTLHGHKFIATVDGRKVATPLLLAVVGLELTDILFAVDSVPAAFSVSREPFIVYTSNAFAILGLRALYIVLARLLQGLKYLHVGLAVVLAFAGAKIMLERWVHIPALASVAFIVVVIAASVWVSYKTQGRAGVQAARHEADERIKRLTGTHDAIDPR